MTDRGSWPSLREVVDPEWTPIHQEQVLHRIQVKRRRRRQQRRVFGGVAGASAVIALGIWVAMPGPAEHRPSSAEIPKADPHGSIRFADGSRVEPLAQNTRVVVTDVTPDRTAVALRQGGARFEVSHNPERRFQVRCASVTVAVKGTEFDVQRQGTGARVVVYQGRVGVSWPGGYRELVGGEFGVFPPSLEHGGDTQAKISAAPLADDSQTREVVAPRKRRLPQKPSMEPIQPWRRLAESGDYAGAYEAIAAGQPVGDEVGELMLAADSARLSGRPRAAVSYLRKVARLQPDDPRSALAAFTIGRIELRAGEPQRAAQWFRVARDRQPRSSLAEHALAREVQARHQSGDVESAHGLARRYLEQFPYGPRAAMVQRLLMRR